MIKLYGFGPAFGLVDASPFVSKVILFMAIHNIEFELVSDASKLNSAPKKKFPYIDDDGEIIADSSFILDHLSKKHNLDIDAWLNHEQRASAYLIGKSLEENLYWCLVHSRWLNDDTWPLVQARFFNPLPFPLNKIVSFIARRGTIKRISGHGMASHTADEVLQIATRSFSELSALLNTKPFFFGDRISSLDLIAFAQISAFTLASLDNPSNREARKHENLLAFTQRIQDSYFSNHST